MSTRGDSESILTARFLNSAPSLSGFLSPRKGEQAILLPFACNLFSPTHTRSTSRKREPTSPRTCPSPKAHYSSLFLALAHVILQPLSNALEGFRSPFNRNELNAIPRKEATNGPTRSLISWRFPPSYSFKQLTLVGNGSECANTELSLAVL